MSISNQTQTKLKYFEDTYLFQSKAVLADIIKDESFPDKQVLILDETIFYPQGGGQPSDTGFIFNNDKTAIFEVEKTLFNPDGLVWHIGNFTQGKIQIGDEIILEIDEQKRRLNSKNHTAGHLIDWAIESLNLDLKANKGFHFPQGAYVEYQGEIDDKEELIKKIEKKANKIISENPKIEFVFENSQHESGKPMRIMKVEGYQNCPCGGTHVKEVSEIGKIKIRKIQAKKGLVKISYQVE
jgi:Ser-tRNA(Ala) deacylase AlaX